ncbi:hypothetical protein [Streptomyces triticiradicis]|uniref:Lipoprotein n=1 Tax=Streptomyces triticiradicis TaxID=2651189 RepID=A0A7J5D9U5_9ACTN|nr:hypothetical protein [Streptomyces triticiradicis]KAB1981397.1 hypothetical protein F8144_32440 [Streptomyces triticiradicis]
MRSSVTALLATAGLALAGCSGLGGDSGPAAGTRASAEAAARAHRACVNAWVGVMSADDYDAGESAGSRPRACDRLPDQLKMFSEAELERATRNRRSVDACIADPSCESWPLTSP